MSQIMQGARGAVGQMANAIAESLRQKEERNRPKYPANPDEQRVLGLIEEAKRVRQYTIEMFEPIWTKCILYAAGVQHLRYIQTDRRYSRNKVEDWVPQPVINIIQPKVQRVVDFFTRNRPSGYVVANSPSEEDQNASRLGDRVLDTIWQESNLEMALDECATWMCTTGNAFIKTYPDTSRTAATKIQRFEAGEEPVIDPMTGQPVIDMQTGQPVMRTVYSEARDPMTGEVLYDEVPNPNMANRVLGPLHMTVPLTASPGGKVMPWLMETGIYPVDYIRELYPDKAMYLPDTGSTVTSDLYIHRITNIVGSGLSGVIRSIDPVIMKGHVIVHQYERMPDPDFPEGICVVECESVPLAISGLPLGDELSYTHFGYYRVPARFWCRGMVEDLIPIQDQVNKLEQMLQQNDAFNVNPMWVVPKNSGITPGRLSNKPGNVVEYEYPHEPKRYPGESMPAQIIQRQQLQMEYAEDVSGVRHVLMGDNPTGVTAGVALARLGEESEGLFAPIEKRYAKSIEMLSTKNLLGAQRYFSLPRYMAVQGEDGGLQEIKDFTGAQLKGNTRVKVESGSYRPRSKAGEQQILFDAFDRGLLPGVMMDPGHHREFLDRVGIAGFDTTLTLDHKRAKWENEMLTRTPGFEQVHRESGDNDAIHLEMHTRFRKTAHYRRLPFAVQQRFLMHELEHVEALEMAGGRPVTTGAEDAQMATDQMAAGGAPTEGGPQNGNDGSNGSMEPEEGA